MSTEHRDLRTERLLRFLECSSKWHRWLTPNQTLLNNPSSASLPNNQTLVNDQTLVNTPSFVNANPLPAPIEILPFVATPIDVQRWDPRLSMKNNLVKQSKCFEIYSAMKLLNFAALNKKMFSNIVYGLRSIL